MVYRHFTIAATMILAAGAARADCIPDSTGMYYCDLPGSYGLSSDADNLNIDAEWIDEFPFYPGLDIPGDGHVVRAGRITAFAAPAIIAGDDLDLTVDWSIKGQNGVIAGDRLKVTFEQSSEIIAGGTGIIAGDDAEVTLPGTAVIDGYHAMSLGDRATVTLENVDDLPDIAAALNTFGTAISVGENSFVGMLESTSIDTRGSAEHAVSMQSGTYFSEGEVHAHGAAAVGLFIAAGIGDTNIDVGFTGVLDGDGGAIRVEGGDADTRSQKLTIYGRIGAVDLGGGHDNVLMAGSEAETLALIDLGDGDDGLRLSRSLRPDLFAPFDGGAGFDTVTFSGFSSIVDGITVTPITDGIRMLIDPPDLASLGYGYQFEFLNFEQFVFDDAVYAQSVLMDRFSTANVPLPASGMMLLAGLCAAGIARRRRA